MTAIVSGAFQEFEASNAPRIVSFSGALSTDSQGLTINSPSCAITAFQWTLLSKPAGAAAPAETLSGDSNVNLTITIPAGTVGSFLYLLRIVEGGVAQPVDLLHAPSSALATASIKSAALGLHLIAEGERFHGARSNENLLIIEQETQRLAGEITAAVSPPYATTGSLGVVTLNEAHYDLQNDEMPAAVYAQGETWRALTTGGAATGLHTHPEYANGGTVGDGTGGAYHMLRPDLLNGEQDIIWRTAGISSAIAMNPTNSHSSITTHIGSSIDGNLVLDSASANTSAVLLTNINSEQDFFAVMDVMVSPVSDVLYASSNLANAESTDASWEVMLLAEARNAQISRYLNNAYNVYALGQPSWNIAAVGMSLNAWTPKAMDFGTAPFKNTFNNDVAGQPVLTKVMPQGSLSSSVMLGVKKVGQTLRCFISTGSGGFYPIGDAIDLTSLTYDYISLFLAARCPQESVGVRVETSALRVISGLDSYGLTPAFNP